MKHQIYKCHNKISSENFVVRLSKHSVHHSGTNQVSTAFYNNNGNGLPHTITSNSNNSKRSTLKTLSLSLIPRKFFIIPAILILFGINNSYAAKYIIQFGGSLGFTYSPNSLKVAVRDTIQWVGDFTMHPLGSTSVPAGAASFTQGTGTSFTYVVTVAGSYAYQCLFHASLGMTGTFTANPTGVENTQASLSPELCGLNQNYPNPFNPSTNISFHLPSRSFVTLKIYNVVGCEVATLVHEELSGGDHTQQWNAYNISSGIYFYRLQAGGFTETKKLVLLR